MLRSLVFLAGAALVSGCTPRVGTPAVAPAVSVPGVPASTATAPAVLNGTVTYLERVALPPGAVVSVRIEDVSQPSRPVLTQQEIRPTVQVPIPFALSYNPADVSVSRRYVVEAEIRDTTGVVLWETTRPRAVLTNGAPLDAVEVVVERVSG